MLSNGIYDSKNKKNINTFSNENLFKRNMRVSLLAILNTNNYNEVNNLKGKKKKKIESPFELNKKRIFKKFPNLNDNSLKNLTSYQPQGFYSYDILSNSEKIYNNQEKNIDNNYFLQKIIQSAHKNRKKKFFLTNSIQPKSYRSISSDLTNTKNLNLTNEKNSSIINEYKLKKHKLMNKNVKSIKSLTRNKNNNINDLITSNTNLNTNAQTNNNLNVNNVIFNNNNNYNNNKANINKQENANINDNNNNKPKLKTMNNTIINNIQIKRNSKKKRTFKRSSVIDRLILKLTNPDEIFEENINSNKPLDKYIGFKKKIAKKKAQIYKILYDVKLNQLKSLIELKKFNADLQRKEYILKTRERNKLNLIT